MGTQPGFPNARPCKPVERGGNSGTGCSVESSPMGCGASTGAVEPPKQLVLLGGGECGKTTIFKQIQKLHGTGLQDKAAEWVPVIHRSPLRSMKVIIAALKE